MWIYKLTVVLLIIPSSLNSECKIKFEEISIEEIDDRYVAANCSLYNHKGTGQNRGNITIIWKAVLPDDTKMGVKGTKWVKNDYKFVIFNIERPFKSFLEMDAFGLQTLCQEHVRPRATWPLKTNVPYRLTEFYMDGSKFPPNLPDGKWRVTTVVSLPNKTKILSVAFKLLMEYV